MGAYVTNSRYDGLEITAKARQVFRESFADRVREEHPELDEEEVQRRGAFARRAWYAAMSIKANKAKSARRAQREAAAAKRYGLTPAEPPPEDAGLGSPVLLPVAPGPLPDPAPSGSDGDGSGPEQP
jgi:hypothetical protein